MESQILYYTVEKQLQDIDTMQECTGWKTIQVYKIENNIPKIFCQIEVD